MNSTGGQVERHFNSCLRFDCFFLSLLVLRGDNGILAQAYISTGGAHHA